MHIFTGSIEVQMLLWSVVLGIVHLAIATTMSNIDLGLAYNISCRDTPPGPVGVVTARLLRAFENFKETFVFFAVAVLVLGLMTRQSPASALVAQLYFWARLVYVPVYAAGIPVLRTLVWTVSIVGLVMVLAASLA